MQVIEPSHESGEISDAVAVCIHVGRNGEAIDHCVFVPEVVDHAAVSSRVVDGERRFRMAAFRRSAMTSGPSMSVTWRWLEFPCCASSSIDRVAREHNAVLLL